MLISNLVGINKTQNFFENDETANIENKKLKAHAKEAKKHFPWFYWKQTNSKEASNKCNNP